MRLIESSVSMIKEDDPLKKIEIVGRTCYKSEVKDYDSTVRFYRNLIINRHFAMLEHSVFLFEVDPLTYHTIKSDHRSKYLNFTHNSNGEKHRYLISGNLRALNEFGSFILLNALYNKDPNLVYSIGNFVSHSSSEFAGDDRYFARIIPSLFDLYDSDIKINEDEFLNHFYPTFHFICDRGVSHEIVRHRPASYAQESTRYCNYSKSKFGSELTFIIPADYDKWSNKIKNAFNYSLVSSENSYMFLLSNGALPQEARAVLPNAVKTEIIMTACAKEYEHFFDLRVLGITGSPHPDMKKVATPAYEMYKEIKGNLIN